MIEREKILIIEDDIDLIEAMKVVLEAKNYRVSSAFSPDEGFDKAKKEKFDLIILDVMFGNEQRTLGFDYAVKARQDKALASIPILMITSVNINNPGFNISPNTDGAFLPVDDFIDKPAQPADLVEKTEKLLRLKKSKWVDWPEKQLEAGEK